MLAPRSSSTAAWSGLGRVEVGQQSTGVDDEGGHAYRSPKPTSSSSACRAIGRPLENRPPRGRGSDSADHLADGLADDLGLGNALLSCRTFDSGLEITGQVKGRLLHKHKVPPVAVVPCGNLPGVEPGLSNCRRDDRFVAA